MPRARVDGAVAHARHGQNQRRRARRAPRAALRVLFDAGRALPGARGGGDADGAGAGGRGGGRRPALRRAVGRHGGAARLEVVGYHPRLLQPARRRARAPGAVRGRALRHRRGGGAAGAGLHGPAHQRPPADPVRRGLRGDGAAARRPHELQGRARRVEQLRQLQRRRHLRVDARCARRDNPAAPSHPHRGVLNPPRPTPTPPLAGHTPGAA